MKAAVLIVDDEAAVQETWEFTVQRFNRARLETDLEFVPYFASSKDEAESILRRQKIDCVITDLRLERGGLVERGEIVIASARRATAAPIAIMSGHLEEFEAQNQEYEPVKTFVKEGDQYAAVLRWFNDLQQLVRVSSMARERLQQVFADLFHRALWKNWQLGALDTPSIDAKVRHLVAQVGDEMTAGVSASRLWPEEFYIHPALRAKVLTGDLLRLEGVVYVVVTPPCDLANCDIPESLLLAECESQNPDYERDVNQRCDTNSEKAGDAMRRFINQERPSPATHFLPPFAELGPWFVSFKKLKGFSKAELEGGKQEEVRLARFASIAPQFVPNLAHRFASYLGRPGQPDIDSAVAVAQLIAARRKAAAAA